MIAKATEFAAVLDDLQEKMVAVGLVADDAAVMFEAAASRMNDLADAAAKAGAAGDLAASGIGEAAKAAAGLAVADAAAAASSTALADAQGGAAAAAATTYGWFRLTGNAIHWIVAGSAELLAVLVPATVAAGAWAFAWAQGAGNVYEHLEALYTATEALGQQAGQTMGDLLGLNGVWQKIQNEANVDVYQAFGAGINLLKESTGGLAQVGLQVGQIFDTFAAKVVYDFSAAGQAGQTMDALLRDMVPDLVKIGEFFGNIGAAIGSFAAQMPGLAEQLLTIITDLSEFVKWIVEVSQALSIGGVSILTVAMAFEEFNRWGSLVVSLMGRLGIETTAVSGGFFTLERASTVFMALFTGVALIIPRLVTALGVFIAEFELLPGAVNMAGGALAEFGAEAQLAIAALTPFQAILITIAAVGLGILIDKLVTSQSAAQKLTAAMQDQVTTLKNNFDLFGDVASNIDTLNQAIASNNEQIAKLAPQAGQAADATSRYSTSLSYATLATETLNQENATYHAGVTQQAEDSLKAAYGATQIAQAYGVSLPQAMAIANAANVNLSNSLKNANGQWTVAGEQIRDYMRGLQDMGVPAGAVGNDMLALAISSGEAATKMSQLNQAWDQFMSTITGGTSGLASFVTGMSQIGQIAGTTALDTGTATDGMTLSTQQFAQALTSMSGNGAQAWTNFDQVVGSTAPQLIDWLRTAGTMGAVSGKQVQQAGLDMISGLIPLAASSTTAQAELLALAKDAGLNVTTFPQLEQAVKSSGATVQGLTPIVDTATTALGNMAIDAENLGDVMQQQVTAGVSAAALKASGFTTDVQNMMQAQETGADVGGKSWQQWAQLASQAFQEAQNAAGAATKAINGDLATLPTTKTVDVNVLTVYSTQGTPTAYSQGAEGHAVAGVGGATGGYVRGPGSSTSDSIPSWLSHGEYVMNAAAVGHYGRSVFDALNAQRLAGGGPASITPGLVPTVLEATIGGGGPLNLQHTSVNHFSVGGRRLGSEIRREQLVYDRRNATGNLTLGRQGTPR